jgi:lipopolysaccharide export system permease protein
MFILLMQFVWLYIDDLAGKGLSWLVIGQLLFYFSASIIPLALPLSILLASIMTFGNLGETYELVAAKAAGVSIWRIFRPMFVAMIFLAGFAFFVSNVLIPTANLKKSSLLFDIKQQKPTVLINEGSFYTGIEGISLRVGKKDPVTGELRDLVIYDSRGGSARPVVVTAASGHMSMSEDKRYMFLTLYQGARYEEMDDQQGYERTYPHSTTTFGEEQIIFDMYAFNLNRTDESLFKDHFQMLNVLQLQRASDSLKLVSAGKAKVLRNNLDPYFHLNDSVYGKVTPVVPVADPAFWKHAASPAANIVSNALNNARAIKAYVDFAVVDKNDTDKLVVRHDIEWHRKYTLAVACIVMFFIGAPFGAIVRKGGFGLPVVISVLLYILFHFLSITGEKMAKGFTATPASSMWLSIMILAPVGFFLTFQAANDSGIFDASAWVKVFRKLTGIKRR